MKSEEARLCWAGLLVVSIITAFGLLHSREQRSEHVTVVVARTGAAGPAAARVQPLASTVRPTAPIVQPPRAGSRANKPVHPTAPIVQPPRATLPANTPVGPGPLVVGWHDEMNRVDQWTPLPAPNSAAVAAPTPGQMELSLEPKPAGFPYSYQWGGVRQIAAVDLDRYPVMAVQAPRVGPHAYWDVGVGLVKPGGEVIPTLKSKSETKGGLQFVDVGAAGLKGEQQLEIRLHVGGSIKGYEVADYDWVRFIRRQDETRLQEDPDLPDVRLDASAMHSATSPGVQTTAPASRPGPVSGITLVQIGTLEGHRGPVGTGIRFSPDGAMLASSAEDGLVIVRSIPSGAILKTLPGHLPAGNTGVSFSPDGKLLAAPAADGNVKLWNTSNWSVWKELPGGACPLAFSPMGRDFAAYLPSNSAVDIWNIKSGAVEHVLPVPAMTTPISIPPGTPLVEALCYSPGGTRLATAGADGAVRIWSSQTGALLKTLRGHVGVVRCLSFSGDGRWLASAGEDQVVRLWPMDGGAPKVIGYSRSLIGSVAFSRDGAVVAAGAEGQILFWDAESGTPLRLVHVGRDWINALAFSPNGHLFAAGSRDHSITLWRYSEIHS